MVIYLYEMSRTNGNVFEIFYGRISFMISANKNV